MSGEAPWLTVQPPPPLIIRGKTVTWRPLAFLEKSERSSDYRVQDADGREYRVRTTPAGTAAWIATEPDEDGRPIIALFTQNRLEVQL